MVEKQGWQRSLITRIHGNEERYKKYAQSTGFRRLIAFR